MKKIILAAVLLIAVAASAQKNTVNILFNEPVQIQDLGLEQEFGTYIPILYGTGVMKFDVHAGETPMHLIVHTLDNKTFNLIIVPTDRKADVPKFEWVRKDKVIDLRVY